MNHRLRRSSSFAAALLAATMLCGCPSTATTSSSPIVTGVEILASTVVASHGCGKEPTQVYRYTAVIYHARSSDGSVAPVAEEPAIASNLFECYADGLFSNLPSSASGGSSYVVRVYGYSYAAFQQDAAVAALQCGVASPPPCPAEDPAVVTGPAVTAAADFTLDCTATEEQGVPVLARCVEGGTSAPIDASVAAQSGEAGPGDAPPPEAGQLDP